MTTQTNVKRRAVRDIINLVRMLRDANLEETEAINTLVYLIKQRNAR